ncbi:MAG: phospholipase D-like domain-containing protein [Candidatus Anstonellales archaeon]
MMRLTASDSMFKKEIFVGFAIGFLLCFIFANAFLVSPVFSPENGEEMIGFIDSAMFSVDAEVYAFSSWDVARALVNAEKRGVNVRVIVDKSTLDEENRAIVRYLKNNGVEVRLADYYQRTHAKFIVVDGVRVLVGSHNFSNSALYYNREASAILNFLRFWEFGRVFEEDWGKARAF